MVELLAIRHRQWIRMPMDSVREAQACADAAIEQLPGPFSPEAIFTDGKPTVDLYTSYTGRPMSDARKGELQQFYNQAEETEYY